MSIESIVRDCQDVLSESTSYQEIVGNIPGAFRTMEKRILSEVYALQALNDELEQRCSRLQCELEDIKHATTSKAAQGSMFSKPAPVPVVKKIVRRKRFNYSPETQTVLREMIVDNIRLMIATGINHSQREYDRQFPQKPSVQTLRKRLGVQWNDLVREAGGEPYSIGRQPVTMRKREATQ